MEWRWNEFISLSINCFELFRKLHVLSLYLQLGYDLCQSCFSLVQLSILYVLLNREISCRDACCWQHSVFKVLLFHSLEQLLTNGNYMSISIFTYIFQLERATNMSFDKATKRIVNVQRKKGDVT